MAATAKKGLEQYMLQLQLHPLRTKAITAGVLTGISDSVAQKLSGIPRIQLRRLLLKVLFGFAYAGPVGHFFHKLMDIIFKGKKDKKTVAKKVLLEQLTSSPCTHFLFLVYYGLIIEALSTFLARWEKTSDTHQLSHDFLYRSVFSAGSAGKISTKLNREAVFMIIGRPWSQVRNKVRKEYPSVQLTAWTFWPVVGWVNYRYMPLKFRVVFHSFVACCWGIFLNLRARTLTLTK